MKRKKLMEYFHNHISNNAGQEKLSDNEQVAVLFVSKDIKIDRVKSRIRLPTFGWVDAGLSEDMSFKFDWVAVFSEFDSSFHMVFGVGNPYECTDLPMKNGIVTAVPFGF